MILFPHFFKDVGHFEKKKLLETHIFCRNDRLFEKKRKVSFNQMYDPDRIRGHRLSKGSRKFENYDWKKVLKFPNLVTSFAGNNPHICSGSYFLYQRQTGEHIKI